MDEPKKKKKTGGRAAGTLNKRTLIGKSVAETLSNWLGFDDAAVERTGLINGDGYRGRQKLLDMWNDKRPVDPQHVALAKFLFSYAHGLPGKHQEPKPSKEPFLFINYRHGHDPMEPKTTAMLEAKAQEERLLAIEAGTVDPETIISANAAAEAKLDAKKDAEGEGLEVVDLPVPDLSAIRDMMGPPSSAQYERDRAPRGER
jgi:hypothetical protein